MLKHCDDSANVDRRVRGNFVEWRGDDKLRASVEGKSEDGQNVAALDLLT